MPRKTMRIAQIVVLGVSAAAISWILGGCQSSGTQAGAKSGPIEKMMAPATPKAGAELWAENCSRCHNLRRPEQYSDQQWAVVVHHMRLRGSDGAGSQSDYSVSAGE